jgi:hypothetical protein
MRASITAYSTAVGPSSFFRNALIDPIHLCMTLPLSLFRSHQEWPARPLHGLAAQTRDFRQQSIWNTGGRACRIQLVGVKTAHPFGNLATRRLRGPMALRPRLATSMPFRG